MVAQKTTKITRTPKASTKPRVKKERTAKQVPIAHAVGRRKNAVARIWVRRGSGDITINDKDIKAYFDTTVARRAAVIPLEIHPMSGGYDIEANVYGGGKVGQSAAVRLGIARALVSLDDTLRPLMRQHGFLTVDARQKERKKYGRRGARRRFQFVKR